MPEAEVGNPEAAERGSGMFSELENISSQASYDAFLQAARALEPGFIEECSADVVSIYHSVTRGVEDVLGSGTVVIGRLPNVNVVELSMLPRLAQGLAFASLQVEREFAQIPFGPMFERAQHLRRKLRKAAEAFAEAGLLPEADIDEVWLHAQQDVLDDCMALSALMRRNEAQLSGRSPVDPSEVLEAQQTAETLRLKLGRAEAGERGGPSLVKLLDLRDRFWTLLKQRHDVLWRCGAWLYGRAVDDHVPALPMRRGLASKSPGTKAALAPPLTLMEPVRVKSPPMPRPERALPASTAPEPDTSRHLQELQRNLERKTRFLVRIGAVPTPPRR